MKTFRLSRYQKNNWLVTRLFVQEHEDIRSYTALTDTDADQTYFSEPVPEESPEWYFLRSRDANHSFLIRALKNIPPENLIECQLNPNDPQFRKDVAKLRQQMLQKPGDTVVYILSDSPYCIGF